MSKNTLGTQFRKIDVDQFSEDAFKEEEQCVESLTSSITGIDEKEVLSLLSQGRHGDALKQLLTFAPINIKNQTIKDNAYNLVMQTILNVRSSEIDKLVDPLNSDQIDVLMKYIYRGFESPSDGSSAHLLVWHEKTYNKGGVGSIVRVMTDKKRV